MLRVCQTIEFPPQDTPHELIQMIEEKLKPCLKLTINDEGEHMRYSFSLEDNAQTTIVRRAHKGKTELVDQLFCKCDKDQVDQFLKHLDLR